MGQGTESGSGAEFDTCFTCLNLKESQSAVVCKRQFSLSSVYCSLKSLLHLKQILWNLFEMIGSFYINMTRARGLLEKAFHFI